MAMKAQAKYFWLGLVVMALGILVLGNAAVASAAVATVTGLFLLLGGGAQILLGFSTEGAGAKVLTWFLGALTVFLGWSFLSNPLAGILSLSTMLLILLGASGIVQIVFALRLRSSRFFWPLMIAGLLSLVLAIVVLSSPAATLTLLGVLMGLQLLSAGATLTMCGMALKELSA